MSGADTGSSGTEHKFDTGDVFEDAAGDPWEVTNRMVDVDTGERLYYLQGTDPDEWNYNESESVPESTLERDSAAWWYVETATDHTGGDDE